MKLGLSFLHCLVGSMDKMHKMGNILFLVYLIIRFQYLAQSQSYFCFLGSGSDRGRCPVEHRGKIPSVHTSVRPPPRAGSGYLVAGSGHLRDGWTDGWTDGWMDGWTDGRTDGRNFLLCSTGHRPLLGPLPCLHLALAPQLMAGQGYRWPLDAFGWLGFFRAVFPLRWYSEHVVTHELSAYVINSLLPVLACF